jgi:hypothetical protein
MLPNHGDYLVRHEQYQDLLREAEKERLVQAAELRQAGKWGLPWQTAHWMGSYIVKWGLKLQTHRSNAPTCRDDCGLVELKADIPI